MKLYEEFKLYENMWDVQESTPKVVRKKSDDLWTVSFKNDTEHPIFTGDKARVDAFYDHQKDTPVAKARGGLVIKQGGEYYAMEESVKTTALPSNGYRVVLADYDTDDFDINVEFGMQDPDENEVVDYEYLLKPGQTRGDLVVYLSYNCGFTSIYVHDERPATTTDIKRLSSETFPVTDTGDEYKYYGDID